MTEDDDLLFDDEAGPLVRAFAVTSGRTRPSRYLDMVTLVMTVSPGVAAAGPEHRAILRLCTAPRSVAEIASTLNLPLVVAKVLVSDLVELSGVVFKTPLQRDDPGFDRELIRTVIDGVRRL
jgi:Protein of unknown function (DUF742)